MVKKEYPIVRICEYEQLPDKLKKKLKSYYPLKQSDTHSSAYYEPEESFEFIFNGKIYAIADTLVEQIIAQCYKNN